VGHSAGDELTDSLFATAQDYLALARASDFSDAAALESAARCLMMVLELEPEHAEAIKGLAYVAAQTGLYEWALDLLAQAALLQPKDAGLAVLDKEIRQLAAASPERLPADRQLLRQLIAGIRFERIPRAWLVERAALLPTPWIEGESA
jgi:hypothetical protein